MKRLLIAAAVCYASWIGMLVLHEFGHAIGAWTTGGSIVSVSIPPLGFSQTIIEPNPRERVVVWCGPIVGSALPLFVALIWKLARRSVPNLLLFFAGFCAIANGAYLGLGWIWRAGDAGDLVRLGIPRAMLILFGTATFVIGLTCWHNVSWLSRRAARHFE